MSGKTSRTKGHSFERWAAQEFRELGWPKARRHLEYQDGEAYGVDLANTDPFLVQCKRGKQYAPITAIFEIQKELEAPAPQILAMDRKGRILYSTPEKPLSIPLLLTKGDRNEVMAVLPWEALKRFIRISADGL